MRHAHNTNVSMLQLKQLGSVTTYFNYFDNLQYRLSDLTIEQRYNALLVSMMTAGLKPILSKKLLEDSSKLKLGYTLQQLKDDALSIESAQRDSDVNRPGKVRFKSNLAAVAEPKNKDDNEEYYAYVADLKSKGRSVDEAGPRPAYEHPEWYRRDGNSCRFCKAIDHNTAPCNKLYKLISVC